MDIRTIGKVLVLAINVSMLSIAQTAQKPAFEVASIKPQRAISPGTIIDNQAGGRFIATNATVRMLISYAFRDMQDYRIVADQGWLTSDRFDIEAHADRALTNEEASLAVRSLLETRFQMKAHTEMREMAVYGLTVAKEGLKMKRAEPPVPPAPEASANAPVPRPGTFFGPGIIESPAISMSQLVNVLSAMACRPVLDHTGAKDGYYEVHVHFTPESCPGNVLAFGAIPVTARPHVVPDNGPGGSIDPSQFSIFTALQEQLGLKLESARGPVDVLVIDSVSKPSEN